MPEKAKYIELKAEFDDFYEQPVSKSFKFSKPTTSQVERTNKALQKSPGAASKNLLLWIVHPDQKDEFARTVDEYPGVAQTFVDEIYRRMGYASLGK